MPSVNPLLELDDNTLRNAQTMLALVCLRSKSVTRRKHAVHACALLRVLQIEGDRRGTTNPGPPWKA